MKHLFSIETGNLKALTHDFTFRILKRLHKVESKPNDQKFVTQLGVISFQSLIAEHGSYTCQHVTTA